jgi:large conductance mechanosensitive channel
VLKGFRDFILRGNVVDMAVGIIIGAAFKSVVDSLVKDVFTPLIAAIAGKSTVHGIGFAIHGSPIDISDTLNAAISFLIVATVVYFCVVMPMQFVLKKITTAPPPPAAKKTCPECLSEIPAAARRCAQCGQLQPDQIPEPVEVTA